MTAVSAPLSASRVQRGLSWSLAGNVVLRLGNLFLSVMIARLIAPEQYGTFAVAMTVWTILGTLAEFGLGADLVRSSEFEARAPTVAALGLATTGTLAAGMLLAAEPIAVAFGSAESANAVRIMAVSIAVFGLGIVPAARMQRQFRQGGLLVCNVSGLVVCAATTWVLATRGAGAEALAWGQVANQAVIVVCLYVATRTLPRVGYRADVFRESVAFCLPLALANALSWVVLSVDNLIVARTLGPVGLGFYVLAFNVSSWPMSVLGTAIRVVALPAFSQVGSVDQRNRALVRAAAPTAAVGALIALVLAVVATPVVQLLYGTRWTPAAAALTGLAVFGGIRVLIDLVATFLIAVGATAQVLWVQVAWVAVMVPVMLVAVGRWGLQGAGWSHVAVALGVVLPLYLRCLRRAGVDTALLVRRTAVPVLACVPAAAASALAVRATDASPLVTVTVGSATALAVFALVLGRWLVRALTELRAAGPTPATPEGDE